ncbi:cation transporter [Amnibacterium flavum]|uniref:Heavy metal transporter n=1 Tax=Amnibacterium flavum TaxID=2173173 RepID=A0A2V1HSV6_9MICO|nr:cation transporter [Amnibacterium flavum]PVZ93164.1 heavy metal transporter [Amnibacterium flavum]
MSHHDLGLTDANSGCHCGHHTSASQAPTEASTISTDVLVEGMTCSHCVMSVTEEVTALNGVENVTVDLNAGGASKVTVASTTPIDPAAIRAAIEEAGYSVVGNRS